jgi:hypothetical protein
MYLCILLAETGSYWTDLKLMVFLMGSRPAVKYWVGCII